MSILVFLFGLIIGSFANVVIYRGPAMWGLIDDDTRGNLAFPGSYCPACRTPLRAIELLPLASFIAASGKCRSCTAAIPFRYPIIELLGGSAAMMAFWQYGLTATAAATFMFLIALLILAAIDFETGFLPDALTLPLIVAGLVANGFALFVSFTDALIGAIAGYAIFRTVAFAFYQLRGVDGLGLGDAKLLAAIGAWAGWRSLPAVVLIASLATLAIVLVAQIRGAKFERETPVPFGPALAAAGALVFFALDLV